MHPAGESRWYGADRGRDYVRTADDDPAAAALDESTALYMHEGNRYDLYCFDILQSFMLVIVFDKGGAATAKIGSVWVYAKRAIRDMQELLG